MSKLACRTCGRQVFVTVPFDSLRAEDRRCPRCGAYLDPERRAADRRLRERRARSRPDAGPPDGTAERRIEDRRKRQRRR